MKVKSIKFLSDYKQFKEGQTFYFTSEKDGLVSFDDATFSIIVGRNGSGKTRLMSLIPTLFYHIERYNGKIPADFELRYTLNHFATEIEVTINHYHNLIKVTVPNIFEDMQLVPMRNPHSDDFSMINRELPYIDFSSFSGYCPMTVVTSTFSLHGEYPPVRPNNFRGIQLVSDQTITNIYGRNHYDIGSISRGIVRFIKLFFESKNEIKGLLQLFDLKFNNRVLYRPSAGEDNEWVTINKSWINKVTPFVMDGEAYLNDLEFIRNERAISLSNMSSGEKMLLLRAISILNSIEKESIVIIEEPELHLDQVWNRQLTTLFKALFSGYNSHLIISTHDYSIINSVPMENLVLLNNGNAEEITENTFLASYDELFRILYGSKFSLNAVEETFLKNLSNKSPAELQSDFNEIGDSIYKYLVFKQLKSIS